MAITASAITPDKSLEEFRVEFNKLIQDFDGVASGNTFDQSIIFEGATADAFETTLIVTDPTADRTITLPNVTGTVITTGNSNAGTTTSSSGDADFVLVDDGGVLKKITPSNLGIGGSAGSVAADDIATGDAAVTIATSTGNITIDAQAGDADIIFKGTDDSSDITALTLDMSDAGKAIFNGAISATTITLSADGGLLLPNDGNIGSAGSTAAMQISSGGIVTFADDILIKDGGTIGVASSTSAITIASTGIVTLVDDLILKDAATIGVTSSTSAISIASTGIVTFIDDIVIKDGGTIGAASAPTAMTVSSGGIVTFIDDIVIKDGGTIGTATDADAITIAAAGAVTFSQRDVHSSGITVADDGQIGSASDADAIAISSAGVVTFSQVPLFPANTVETADIQDNAVTPAKIAGAVNAQTGTSYTFVEADAFKTVTSSNGSAQTLTIPPNSSVAFAVGDRIDVVMLGSGTTTVTGGSGVTVNGVSTGSGAIAAQFAAVSCLKLDTNTWVLMGNHGGVS